MNSRQRFACAMQHQSSDRPPLDIGGTGLTALSAGCQANLRHYLGFSGQPHAYNNTVDERILEWAGTDFRAVGAIVDLPSVHTRTVSPTVSVDCWGVRREHIGQYDDITFSPLKGASRRELAEFRWPEARLDETLLARWEAHAQALKRDNQYVIVAEHPVYGILELGCWMCGYEDFLYRLAGDPDFVRAFFDKVFDIQMQVIETYYTVLGPYIDLTTSGDDFGMQLGPLLSPRTFELLITPYFSARITRTKQLAGCYYWHHTCGSVFALLDQLIACGVDILNPLQTSAAFMEPSRLKDHYGSRLVFWGGVDVQHFLPNATPAQVRQEINHLVTVLGEQGGYVIAPAHNMQDDVSPENIVAWVDTINGLQI